MTEQNLGSDSTIQGQTCQSLTEQTLAKDSTSGPGNLATNGENQPTPEVKTQDKVSSQPELGTGTNSLATESFPKPTTASSRGCLRESETGVRQHASESALDFSTSTTVAPPSRNTNSACAEAHEKDADKAVRSCDAMASGAISGGTQKAKQTPEDNSEKPIEAKNSCRSEKDQGQGQRFSPQEVLSEFSGNATNTSKAPLDVNHSASEKIVESMTQSEAFPLDLCLKKSGKLSFVIDVNVCIFLSKTRRTE